MKTMNRHFGTVSTGLLLWGLACGLAPAAQVTLAWDAPTHNLDGSLLSDLAGYRIYHGVATGVYGGGQDLGNATQTVLTGLVAGATNFVAVTAYNSVGIESSFSGEITLVTPPVQWHSADYADPRFEIDSAEVSRVLDYWRTGGYYSDPAGPDGFAATDAPDTVNTNGALHSADYAAPHHVIDASEAARVLAYWRAGGYAPDAAGVDGYVPAGEQPLGGEAPSANAQQ